jgi:hypothetical protein
MQDTLKDAIANALDGDAVLFLGAGFSTGARNGRGESLKDGGELARYFASLTAMPPDSRLEDASEAFERDKGSHELIAELKTLYGTKSVAASHREIAKVPWIRVYTTNYDNVYEVASQLARIIHEVLGVEALLAAPSLFMNNPG